MARRHPEWDMPDYEHIADIALKVIKDWTVMPSSEDEPQCFKQVREIVRQELIRHKLIIAVDSID